MADRLEGPYRKPTLNWWADARVGDAHGSTYDQSQEGWGDWMWRTGGEAASAADAFLRQPVTGADVLDLGKSLPSAVTRIGTNTLGTPRDINDMLWELAQAMNRKQRDVTGYDAGLDIMRGKKLTETYDPASAIASSLPTSTGWEEMAKDNLPEFMTHEPKGNLGKLAHIAADFINPEDIFPPLGVAKISKNLWRRFR